MSKVFLFRRASSQLSSIVNNASGIMFNVISERHRVQDHYITSALALKFGDILKEALTKIFGIGPASLPVV